ncbi:LuxR C-terminal-related transcriptional regulator [Cupriavidus sp. 8B]
MIQSRLPQGLAPEVEHCAWNPEVPAALVSPDCPSDILLRNRLSLSRHDSDARTTPPRFIVLRAPAGWGKSTLLAQWKEEVQSHGIHHAWITLHPAFVSDRESLLRHLAAAWQLHPEAAKSLSSLWQALAPRLQSDNISAVLFADQLEALQDGPAWSLWIQLIESAPPTVRIVMATRGELPSPLIRLRLYGQVREIGSAELRFTSGELREYLSRLLGASGNLSCLDEVMTSTDGWPLAVSLVGRNSLWPESEDRSSDARIRKAISELTGDRADLWSYFYQEVWTPLPPRMQAFLREIAFLENVSGPLCDAVRRSKDSASWLNQCERSQLFIQPLDLTHDWFRLQPLFAQFLARMQGQHASPESLRRASERAIEWLSAHRDHLGAFRLAIRLGDSGRAAEALEAIYDTSYATDGAVFVELARCLPQANVASRPRIQLAIVMRDIVQRRFEDARRMLDAIALQINHQAEVTGVTPEIQELRNLLIHREVLLSFFMEDLASVKRGCEELLTTYPDAAQWIKLSLFTSLLATYADIGNLRRVDALAGSASRLSDKSEASISRIYFHATLSHCYLQMGRSEQAVRQLEELFEAKDTIGRLDASVRAVAGLHLAQALFEINRLAEAEALLDEYLPHSHAHCPFHVQIAGWVTRIRLTRVLQGTEAAIAVADAAIIHARENRSERLELTVQAELMALALQAGRPELVRRIAVEMGQPSTHTQLLPHAQANGILEMRALGWLQTARLQSDLGPAIQLARHWASHHTQTGGVRALIRWTTELVQLQAMQGDTAAAQRYIRRAIELAVEGEFSRRIVDDPTCAALLQERPEIANGLAPLAAAFHQRLVALCHPVTNGLLPGALSVDSCQIPITGALNNAEIEILRMIAVGYGNAEIAKALGRSEASVKWSLQQVFDKLGTRRRRQALERARSLGLLS